MDDKRDRLVGGVLVAQIWEPEFRSSVPTQKYNMKAKGVSIPGTGQAEAEVFLDYQLVLPNEWAPGLVRGYTVKSNMENDWKWCSVLTSGL